MKRLLPILILFLVTSVLQAQSLTTIQLRNRPAVEVIPIVEPLLQDGDVITGHGYKIFLRAPAETESQVRAIIAALDAPAKVLQISVFQGSTRGLSELGFDANIRIQGGDGNIAIGGSGGNSNNGGNVTIGTTRGSGSISGISTQQRLNNSPIHQVRVSEGREAYIETGQQIPIFSGTHWHGHKSTTSGVDYKKVATGFYVLPRIHGDQVTLEVSPFKQSTGNAGGNIATQAANTTITGRIGDWLLIGGVSTQLKQSQKGIGSSVSTQSRSNDSIWIRADLIP